MPLAKKYEELESTLSPVLLLLLLPPLASEARPASGLKPESGTSLDVGGGGEALPGLRLASGLSGRLNPGSRLCDWSGC